MAQAVLENRVEELGGSGWRVRAQTSVVDTVDPWPARAPAPRQRSGVRRAASVAVTLGLFCASGVAAIELTPSHPAVPEATPPLAQHVPTAAPKPATAPPRPVIPVPPPVRLAAREYAGAVAPLNRALDNFQVALHMANSQPCKCPEGAFDGGAALQEIPAILQAFNAVQLTLQHMKTTEAPAFAAHIEAVASAYRQQMASFSAAYEASRANDIAAVDNNLAALTAEQATAQPALAALKAVLTLSVGPTL